MQCPFLNKTSVKYCGLCRRTLIPLTGSLGDADLCSGPGYLSCPLLKDRQNVPLDETRCPYLCVADVHSCGAAPFRKQIPCNQTTLSRCTNEGHVYCQLFLSLTEASPAPAPTVGTPSATTSRQPAATIDMPPGLGYAPNHMWFDRGTGETWHVGMDAFFGRALGRIDEVIYPHHGNRRRPVVRIRAGGVDFDLAFPDVIQSVEINPHLVVDPSGILTDPYGRGWLFEGASLPAGPGREPDCLREGVAATLWMEEECDRLESFVRDHLEPHGVTDTRLRREDRGPLGTTLDAPALMRLYTEFFTLKSGRTVT